MTVGQLIAGRYRIEEVVGSGGMSSVYRAHDTLLERQVALKVLHAHHGDDEEYVERFRREARAVAQLSHPGIVTVIDRGEEDGREFIVFELVAGETLKELVEREGALPIRRTLELGIEIGRALAFAHEQGLVHRDVKPQNVLLDVDGRAKVTDFGIVRSLDGAGSTATGTVLGSSHYIAPEQARGERVDAKTDVYSFGVVLFELIAGEVPYDGESFLAVAMRHANDPVPSVLERRPECPLRLVSLVERCLAKDPADRPGSMAEVVTELEACLAGLGAEADGDATRIVRSPLPQRARPRGRRQGGRALGRRSAALGTLVVLALAAVAGAAFLLGDDDENARGGGGGGQAVRLAGVASYDPFGDDRVEHPEAVGRATDRDPSTYWPTSTYYGAFTKEGVGLVLDARRPVSLASVTVVTDTPGFTAEIRAGDAAEGPFEQVVGAARTAAERTTWELEDAEARYYVVWIIELQSLAHVNEVTARA